MFAIIDIETCGGTYEYRKGAITEICILVHDGLQVVDKFTTLINPQCHISHFYRNISGITDEMVAAAPKFYEVAPKILEMTENRIFVAHNVSFDYNFIKAEFASLGYKFKREKLCTVRLARKLLPGRISYSLGHLCASLGIDIENRHRAEGDAVATARLFDLLMQIKSQDPQYRNTGIEGIMTRRIDKIKEYILKKLPEECGVYYFLDKDQNIIYIGKSLNMYNRAISHFNTQEKKGKNMLNKLYNVDFVLTGSEAIALLLESEEIKKHKPKFNRSRVADTFTHSIDWFVDDKGAINFKIVPYQESENPLQAFTSLVSARERLEYWIDEYTLCISHCGLVAKDSVCFNHQIKKCNGICAGREEADVYNLRANEILKQYLSDEENFAIIDKGRTEDERSVILVEKRRYSGYGYIDNSCSVSNTDELKSYITKARYFPDADVLLRGWVKRSHGLKKIVW
ncbi:MAG TPA: exonuclease domain-containing protein [Bacteroidales bacterium]|nr:exonuclease domain-containing protein [Bacteroidales bacterium]